MLSILFNWEVQIKTYEKMANIPFVGDAAIKKRTLIKWKNSGKQCGYLLD
jgi:hypothetical protein